MASGCDNVAWGGVELELTPPPAAVPGTPADVAPEEPPPPPEVPRPLLLAGTRTDAAATLVVVGELAENGGVVAATATSLASGATPGSEWILFANGVRVGRMRAETVEPAQAYCPSTPALTGTIEIVPTASAVERFLALPAEQAGEVEHRPYRALEDQYDQRVASLTFAQEAIPRLGGRWPEGGVLTARADIQAFQPAGTDAPTLAASYVYRDGFTVGNPQEGAYALFNLSSRQGGQFRETFQWFQAADSLGKAVPRYFGHVDVNGDGEGEIVLDVFGSGRRWHAVLEQTDGGWTRSFVSPCGAGTTAAP